jgi:hypothetical protein
MVDSSFIFTIVCTIVRVFFFFFYGPLRLVVCLFICLFVCLRVDFFVHLLMRK